MTPSGERSGVSDSALLHQLQQLVTHVDAVLWLTTPDKREMPYLSPAFERVFGEPASKIFEPFFTTKGAEAGTGLGLAMVYGCIRQHGGQIRCASRLGTGTTFTVLFAALDQDELVDTPMVSRPPASASSDTILLVEDQEAVRRLVARILASEGYRVVQAADGHEALERATTLGQTIGLLVSDVIMPTMGGYELLARLRLQNPGIRALFMSGYAEDSNSPRRAPDAHFLPKPFAVDALKRFVRQVLA